LITALRVPHYTSRNTAFKRDEGIIRQNSLKFSFILEYTGTLRMF